MASLTLGMVNDAIIKILTTGQSYSRAGFTFTRGDLGKLKELRKELKSEAAAASADGMGFVFDMSGGDQSADKDWE